MFTQSEPTSNPQYIHTVLEFQPMRGWIVLKNKAMWNENILETLLDSPDAPLEQAYLTYKIGWLPREGWESQPPHQQISTDCPQAALSLLLDFADLASPLAILQNIYNIIN